MEPEHTIKGLHHITLIASDAARTSEFYGDLLGLQPLQKAIDADRLASQHLCFGDAAGMPGSLISILVRPDEGEGEPGIGFPHHFALTVDSYDALLKWKRRLQDAGVLVAGPYDQQAYQDIVFDDADGTLVEIATRGPGWAGLQDAQEVYYPPLETMAPYRDEARIAALTWSEPVPAITPDMALQGLHHVTIPTVSLQRMDAFCTGVLAIPLIWKTIDHQDSEVQQWYWGLDSGRPGTVLAAFPTAHPTEGGKPTYGRSGLGVPHHFGLKVADEAAQRYWHDRLSAKGFDVAAISDRTSLHAIELHDHDGLLVEIATEAPWVSQERPAVRGDHDLVPGERLQADRER